MVCPFVVDRLSPLPLPSLWKNTRGIPFSRYCARARVPRPSSESFARNSRDTLYSRLARPINVKAKQATISPSENRMLFTFASGKTRGVCRVVRGELKNKQRRRARGASYIAQLGESFIRHLCLPIPKADDGNAVAGRSGPIRVPEGA